MAATQAELDALIAAKNSGVLTVKYADRTVTYRSLAEIENIIADMQRCLNGANARPVAAFASYNRGHK